MVFWMEQYVDQHPSRKRTSPSGVSNEETSMKRLFTEAWRGMQGKRGKGILSQRLKGQRKGGTESQESPVPAEPRRSVLWSSGDTATARDTGLKQEGVGKKYPRLSCPRVILSSWCHPESMGSGSQVSGYLKVYPIGFVDWIWEVKERKVPGWHLGFWPELLIEMGKVWGKVGYESWEFGFGHVWLEMPIRHTSGNDW